MKKSLCLTGLRFLNTRPRDQADSLNKELELLGAETVSFPALHIVSTNQKTVAKECRQLHQFDVALFISANAANFSQAHWPKPFPSIKICAIGPGTEKSLKQLGLSSVTLPNQFNSQGLLALPECQSYQSRKIIIFCGKNPKKLLQEKLIERGITVTLCECYKRIQNQCSKAIYQKLSNSNLHFDGIISTSQTSLKSFYKIIGSRSTLKKTPITVISPEMQELAYKLGWEKVWISPNASNNAIVKTLLFIHSK